MTQEDLCAATDYVLAPGYLSRLERNPVNFSWPIFEAICDVLSVESSDVIREAKSADSLISGSGGAAVVREPSRRYIAERQEREIDVIDMQGEATGTKIVVPAELPAGSFGYRVDMISMESDKGGISYFRNCIAVISANQPVNTGDDCLVMIDSVFVLCRYEFDGRHHWITYLNRSYPRELMQSKDQIRGLVTGLVWFNPNP